MQQAAIIFPNLSPEIFSISIGDFTLSLRWYALAYIVGLIIGWRIITALVRTPRLWPEDKPPMTAEQVESLLTWIILGVLIGGRLGFVLFYEPAYYLTHPAEILRIWEGGMSFHGGLAGVCAATLIFCARNGVPLWSTADALAVAVGPGLFLGRIANFINAELWGRPTTVPWGVVFPGEEAQSCPLDWIGPCARHPSQLYEALLEGLVLGGLLLWLAWRRGGLKRPGMLAGVFFAGYGIARFVVEFFRLADARFITPDNPHGHVLGTGAVGITMGQLLSLPMVAIGLWLIWRAGKRA